MRNPLKAIIFRAKFHLPNALTSAGLLDYRAVGSADPASWDSRYATSELDHYAELESLARYGVLIAYLQHIEARSVLDVGCGVGLLRQRIEPLGFERYVGIDLSAVAIERARALEDERTTFAVGSRATPDMGRFHVVVCNDVLMYMRDAPDFLDHVRRILEPDGYLLSCIWRHTRDVALHQLLDERFELLDRVEIKQLFAAKRHRWQLSCHRRLRDPGK